MGSDSQMKTASHWGHPASRELRQPSHMVAWGRSNSHIVELSPQVLAAAKVPYPDKQSCFWAEHDESVEGGGIAGAVSLLLAWGGA